MKRTGQRGARTEAREVTARHARPSRAGYDLAMHRYTCLVVCFAIGCSQGPKRKVLSSEGVVEDCAVDEHFVYVKSFSTLSKIDRRSGKRELLTNDTHDVRAFIPVDGAIYWLDRDGIYARASGASTRTTIARYSVDSPHSLVQFENRLCWGRDDKEMELQFQREAELSDEPREARSAVIECYDLVSKKIEPWLAPKKGRSPRVATHGGRLYAALVLASNYPPSDDTYPKTNVFDITNAATPIELFTHPGATSWFAATPAGPVSIAERKLWISSDRTIGLDPGYAIRAIDGRIYLTQSKGAVRIDLKSGTEAPQPGAPASVMCGDSLALYVRGQRGELVEIAAPTDR